MRKLADSHFRAALAAVTLLISSFPPLSVAGEMTYNKIDLALTMNTWRIEGEGHAGMSLSAAWYPAEQHRLRYRHTRMNNEVSNALRAASDIIICTTTLGQADRCEYEDSEYLYWREDALLYQYRLAARQQEGRRSAVWFGAGPARVHQEVRLYDSDADRRRTLAKRDNTGLAWSLDASAHGQRAFFTAAIAGNSRGRAVGLNLGFGFSFF